MSSGQELQPDGVIPYSKSEHYEIVSGWWAHYYDGDPLPVECLPSTGAVALYRGKPAAVSFYYETNAKMVMMALPMADPALGAGRRIAILRAAIAGAIAMAKEFLGGQGFVWCCTDNAVVARIYAENQMICPGEADVYFLPVGTQNHKFLT